MFKHFFSILALICNSLTIAWAQERITHFNVIVTVHEDGFIDVVETLHVVSQGQQIKRGIVREFPTVYHDTVGTRYSVDFAIDHVLHNNESAHYHTESASDGIRIFIGDRDTHITSGMHVYTIAYRTNRQIGHFQDHDEFFWNITGNGWRLPIDQVHFQIKVPKNIPVESIKTIGYTGYEGERGTHYTMGVDAENAIVGTSTRALRPYEGLSVAVAWPKGYITQPTLLTTIYYFVYDNILLMLLVLIIILCSIVYVTIWVHSTPLRNSGTIIPLFYPPDHLSPAQIACINAMCYTSKAMTASIVNLAVQGIIIIQQMKDELSFATYYVLNKIASCDSDAFKKLNYYDKYLATRMFPGDRIMQCKLGEDAQARVVRDFKDDLERHLKLQAYIDTHAEARQTLIIGSLCGFIAIAACAVTVSRYAWIMDVWFFIAAVIMVGVHYWGAWLIKHYTQRGRALKDQIDGFKLFLETTEKDRLALISTPPEETPQLYETYLPYAIALGVEAQWSKKFAAIFANMEAAGQPYAPVWYIGRPFTYHHFPFAHMGRTVHNLSSSAISAGYRPGSRSGFGSSGGGAGRGGGGGGGGGW